jgi:hypothetical protein
MATNRTRPASRPRRYSAYVVWEFDYNQPNLAEYDFKSEAERDAFLFGVSEAEPAGEWHESFTDRSEAEAFLEERRAT